jgi:hypothetical protein
METSSFVIALVASGVTLSEMSDHSGTFTRVMVATCIGFIFGLVAHSIQ